MSANQQESGAPEGRELDRRLAEALGWEHDGTNLNPVYFGRWREKGADWWIELPRFHDSHDAIHRWVLPEIERRKLIYAFVFAAGEERAKLTDDPYWSWWEVVVASPETLARAALEVLEGEA